MPYILVIGTQSVCMDIEDALYCASQLYYITLVRFAVIADRNDYIDP